MRIIHIVLISAAILAIGTAAKKTPRIHTVIGADPVPVCPYPNCAPSAQPNLRAAR